MSQFISLPPICNVCNKAVDKPSEALIHDTLWVIHRACKPKPKFQVMRSWWYSKNATTKVRLYPESHEWGINHHDTYTEAMSFALHAWLEEAGHRASLNELYSAEREKLLISWACKGIDGAQLGHIQFAVEEVLS